MVRFVAAATCLAVYLFFWHLVYVLFSVDIDCSTNNQVVKSCNDTILVSCRLASGRWLCGLVCWSLALLVSLWGVPGPDAPPGSEYAYSVVVRQLLEQQQVSV
jgi:hypothetical protein